MPQTPDAGISWTVDTYAAHNEAMREADQRFDDERDRRYAEVNTEREKALKIKETADRDAMALARESQTYKEQQNDALRDKNLSESGIYARTSDVDASMDKLGKRFESQFEALLSKLEPFMNGTIQQKGQQQGAQLTKGSFYSALGGLSALAALLYALYALTHPAG
jgi:vacuolar-type H+-ATPase subunit H